MNHSSPAPTLEQARARCEAARAAIRAAPAGSQQRRNAADDLKFWEERAAALAEAVKRGMLGRTR